MSCLNLFIFCFACPADYAFAGRKFGGNAQSITGKRWLHHTSFLWDYDPERMALLRPNPPRAPAYRAGRGHQDFVVKLKDVITGTSGCEVPVKSLADAVAPSAARHSPSPSPLSSPLPPLGSDSTRQGRRRGREGLIDSLARAPFLAGFRVQVRALCPGESPLSCACESAPHLRYSRGSCSEDWTPID